MHGEKVLSIDKNHNQSLYFLGKIHALEGDIDGAISLTERARNSRPGNILAHAQLSELYLAKGKVKESLLEWDEVLKRDPSNIQALHNIGAIYTDLQMYDETS